MSLFPKVLWPFGVTLSVWSWLRISPYSSLNVVYSLIGTAWQWLMNFNICPVFLCKLNPIKAHWEKGLRPFSYERLVNLSSPSRPCLGSLVLICSSQGSSVSGVPPYLSNFICGNGSFLLLLLCFYYFIITPNFSFIFSKSLCKHFLVTM